jgi:hypothetical protein
MDGINIAMKYTPTSKQGGKGGENVIQYSRQKSSPQRPLHSIK